MRSPKVKCLRLILPSVLEEERSKPPYVYFPKLLGIKGIIKQQIISGVEAGETVVTQGQNRLVDGTPVRSVNN